MLLGKNGFIFLRTLGRASSIKIVESLEVSNGMALKTSRATLCVHAYARIQNIYDTETHAHGRWRE